MQKYLDLIGQLENLDKRIAALRTLEIPAAIEEVRAILRDLHLHSPQLFGPASSSAPLIRLASDVRPTHQNLATGEAWPGPGRKPI
ncbi:H-NS family nucleoid-associated regulatory protein [Burkholderia glumae]|uniref:H-NS histone family protein n=1 Tax=Burkholderia glumae TaxID=337 RepID=A0AAQ0BPL9_BURGL|nr:H-NS family nucleoid-associated regulatory protein [Burkholderia glumae]ACR32271.1 Histone family protein nucleoid-structuring protein H-NS [Burkholderia glumae BGR1]AJY63413.1 H-NS histone family protein [Burkholderia glumae LMG 2196 = ATCC 33617]MCM2484539.1 H-NS histone family protein [Burkholderia glumae]MCM2494919.1 H-NS histone family protein [Burkholderia glumae]MCM2510231.1 H-NS histone family protein [Burkholderia glumae]